MLGWRVIPRVGFESFSVSPHGVGIMLGYFAGVLLMARRARRAGFDEDHVWNAAALGVVGAILGARIAYIAGHFSDFSGPLEWLKIWQGGISLVGGLIGGFGAGYLYVRIKGVDFFRLVDLAAPGVALGTAIGRIGDLLIGDHLGKATSGWWGWVYKGGELISPPPCNYPTDNGCLFAIEGRDWVASRPGLAVHQTALYDQIWSLAILGILLYLDRKPRRRGFLILVWATLYGLGRVATDFLRVDKHWLGIGLTGSQITSIVFILICTWLLVRYRGAPGETETEEPPAPAEPATAAADPSDSV